jgi:prepilin-type N-terminal cleavage/methylation domain-containing protein
MTNRTTRFSGNDGFTLVEMLVVVGIISVAMVTATAVMPGMLAASRSDAATAVVVNTLRLARDRAIGERRNMDVVFIPPNRLQIVREEIGGGTNPVIMDTYLANGQQFFRFASTGDTLDGFSLFSGPLAFGTGPSVATIMFTSEGTLVDASGDPINGTIFVASPASITSARAVTIFGPTALIRPWRWDGRNWKE